MQTMIRADRCFSKRILALLTGLFLLLFAGLTVLVFAGATAGIDMQIARAAEGGASPWRDRLYGWASGALIPLVVLLALPAIHSLWQRRFRFALLISGSSVGSIALNLALKLALRYQPPGEGPPHAIDWRRSPLAIAQQISDSYGYPSGHVTTAVVALGLWVLWLWPHIPPTARVTLVAVALGCATMLSYSRIYLGRHVASDVLGSALVGGALLAGTAWIAVRQCVSTAAQQNTDAQAHGFTDARPH